MGNEKTNLTGKKVLSGLMWTFGERISAQLVTTLVSIILARLLAPEVYGIISIVMVFITFCNVFVSNGFGTALVRKKATDELDFNTTFVVSFSLSIILYGILFFTAPYIAKFYDMDILSPIIRVMALRLPLASINTIQYASIQRTMEFQRFFIVTLCSTIISGIVGISMVYMGFGVWSIVGQYMSNTLVSTIALTMVSSWIPKFRFSISRAKEIIPFGFTVLLSELIATGTNDIRSLVVGKCFGSAELAYYDQGHKFPALFVNNVNSAVNKVMLPSYSRYQDNLIQLKSMVRRTITLGITVLGPILIGFGVVADTFVEAVLTDKWLPSVLYIRLFCLSYLSRPLETASRQVLLALGKSRLIVGIMIVINVFNISTLLIATFVLKNVFMVAVGTLFATLTSLLSYMYFSGKVIDYKLKEQFFDLIIPIMICLVMGIIVYFVGLLSFNPWLVMALQVLVGIASYVALLWIFRRDLFKYLVKTFFNR